MKEQLKSPDLDHSFQDAVRIARSQKFLLSSMICSQIWLSPLLDDCQYTYLTNFIKKNPDSENTKDFFGGRILYFSLTYLKSDRFHAEVTLNFQRAHHATPESRATLPLRLGLDLQL